MGSQPSTQTVTNKTELPPWVDQAAQENLQIANELAKRPYVGYDGQLTAGSNQLIDTSFQNALANSTSYLPLMQSAAGLSVPSNGYYSMMGQAAGLTGLTDGFRQSMATANDLAQISPGFTSALDTASGTASGGASYNPRSFLQGDVSAYMNPYIQNVEDRAIDNQNRAFLNNLNEIGANATSSGAFGGSRHGIAEGVAASENARAIGDLSAQLRAQGYDQASQMLNTDINREMAGQQMRMDAANSLANIAGMGQTARANAANQIAGFGSTAQQLQQQGAGMLAGIGQQMQDTNLAAGGQLSDIAQAGNQMSNQNSALLAALGGQQREIEQAQLQEEYAKWKEWQDHDLQQLNLRLAAVGATPYGSTQTQTTTGSGGGNTGMSVFGSVLGILPMLMGLSDKDDKTDITKLGKDPETGLTMYAYRYKGDPKNTPKVVGPMAQEVEKKYPNMVRKVGGHRIVDGRVLTRNLGFGG